MKTSTFYVMLIVVLILLSGCSDSTSGPKGTVARPLFNIEDGTYGEPQSVVINCETEGAEIYYTLDGTEPTLLSSLYSSPLYITNDKTIKARAYKERWTPSEIAELNIIIDEELAVAALEFGEIPEEIIVDSTLFIPVRILNEENQPLILIPTVTVTAGNILFTGHDEDGWGNFLWGPGIIAQEAVITASIADVTIEKEVFIAPELPASITLSQEQAEDRTDELLIKAVVKDRYENPVLAGCALIFQVSEGSIDQNAVTGADGTAYTTYYPGTYLGTVTVTASTLLPGEGGEIITGTLEFVISDDQVHSMNFVIEGDIHLDAQGTGGTESIELEVELRDSAGNLVSGEHWVKYQIVGSSILYLNGESSSVEVLAENGIAGVTVSTGYSTGQAGVRVTLLNVYPALSLTKPFYVYAQPFYIQPSIDPNTATPIGNGVWRMQAGAYVRDVHNNPVADGTAVYFSIGSEPPPPDNCHIDDTGYTGGPLPGNEEGIPGFAGTYLYYHGENSTSQIMIIAEAGDIAGTITVALPINEPQIVIINIDPPHVLFFDDDEPDASELVQIYFTLIDGQGNDITGATIFLTSSHGHFEYYEWFDDHGNPINDPYIPYDPYFINSYQGMAKGALRFHIFEFPLPDNEEAYSQTDVLISASVLDTDVSVQTTYAVRRYNIPSP